MPRPISLFAQQDPEHVTADIEPADAVAAAAVGALVQPEILRLLPSVSGVARVQLQLRQLHQQVGSSQGIPGEVIARTGRVAGETLDAGGQTGVQLGHPQYLRLARLALLCDEDPELPQPVEECRPVDHQIPQHRHPGEGRDLHTVLEPGGTRHSRLTVQLDGAQST